MQVVYLVLGLLISQVYASILPLGFGLKRQLTTGTADMTHCETACTDWAQLTCETIEDFSCWCTDKNFADYKLCTECFIANPAFTDDEKKEMKDVADYVIVETAKACKDTYGIEVKAENVTISDTPTPTGTAAA